MAIGTLVTVSGVVTSPPGRLGKPPLVAIEDGTAGLVVKLPDGVSPAVGHRIRVSGRLFAPYGQLEIRPGSSDVADLGAATTPTPLRIVASDLGEGLEARLVSIVGRVSSSPRRSTSGDLTIDATDDAGTPFRIAVDASSGIDRGAVVSGGRYRFRGVVGQHASRVGVLDGYRIWLAATTDIVRLEGSGASPSPSPSPSGTARPSPKPSHHPGSSPTPTPSAGSGGAVLTIAGAKAAGDMTVVIEATVTADAGLLDASGRRIVVQDPSGAVEVLVAETRSVRVGDRIRLTGSMGTAYGAPRFRAGAFVVLAHPGAPAPTEVSGAPDGSLEWALVRIRGRITDVKRTGGTWRAEVESGGQSVPISGLAGAGIPSTRMVEGATTTVVGIVRRPYPTANDRRFSVVPRGPGDVAIGATAHGAGANGSDAGDGSTGGGTDSGSSGVTTGAGGQGSVNSSTGGSGDGQGTDGTPRVDLGAIGGYAGQTVTVGGVVAQLSSDGVLLDDGTATVWIVFRGQALSLVPDIAVDDALEVTGAVEGASGHESIGVEDPAAVVVTGLQGGAGSQTTSAAPTDGGPTGGGVSVGIGDDSTVVDRPAPAGPTALAFVVAVALLVGVGVVAAVVAWRMRQRRRVAERVAGRLEALVGPFDAS